MMEGLGRHDTRIELFLKEQWKTFVFSRKVT